MAYDAKALRELSQRFAELPRMRDGMMLRLIALESTLTDPKAKEYAMQGAGRRLGILSRCIENIYRILPINHTGLLPREDLLDLGINLHAFMVNISGLFDNLAWVYAFEFALVGDSKEGKIHRNAIGLFSRDLQRAMPKLLSTYLQSEHLQKWYAEYSKNYRDAVAHRIPLYVPPSILTGEAHERYLELEARIQDLNLTRPEDLAEYDAIIEEQKALGKPSPLFVHSVSELGRPMYLHVQVLADFATVEEVVTTFCACVSDKEAITCR